MYTITLKKKGFLGLVVTEKIKNIKFHNIPNDWNNSNYIMYVTVDNTRHILNMSQYLSIHFPVEAFIEMPKQFTPPKEEQAPKLDVI